MPAIAQAPTLMTARLTLSAPAIADFDDSAALWADPAVVRHIGGKPLSPEDVWSRLLRHAGLWALLGYGYWTVRDAETSRFVGQVGFATYKRDIVPSLGDAPECGWALAPWAHGRGLAREALAAVLAWTDATLDASRTVCFIKPDNQASLRLAARVGYTAFAEGHYKGATVTLFERPLMASDQAAGIRGASVARMSST